MDRITQLKRAVFAIIGLLLIAFALHYNEVSGEKIIPCILFIFAIFLLIPAGTVN